MKKFLLVVLIGMVLAINLYGIVTDIIEAVTYVEPNPLEGIATIVYEE